jgi:hypothetical protein
MTISTREQLRKALARDFTPWRIEKANLANQTAGRNCSMWRSTGTPAQGAIPGTTPAVPNAATLGALPLINQTAPRLSYLAELDIIGLSAHVGVEIHDRIAHNGGLVLNSIVSQAITGFNLATLAPSAARVGESNYSDLQWWLEVYGDGGATASNATINVTFNDASSANLAVLAVGGTIRIGNMFPLTPLIQTADQGKFIQTINSVILSVSTGTAGNFGFTCTRSRTVIEPVEPYLSAIADWRRLGFPALPNDSCLQIVAVMGASNTSTNIIRGIGKVAQG